MKTRKLINVFIAFFALIVIGACTNLDEVVYDQIISEEFVPQERDVLSIIGPSYTQMEWVLFGWRGFFDSQEECSDILVTNGRYASDWVDGGVYKAMHQHTWSAEAGPPSYNIYNNCYTGINNVNTSLKYIDEGTLPIGTGYDEATADAMEKSLIAELKTARSLYYYWLLDNYGRIPITTSIDDSLPTQKERNEVYNFIMDELRTNVPLLTEDNNSKTYGRFNKWAGMALMAKMYLNAEVYIGEPRWDSCILYCDRIMESGKFTLSANYGDPFITENQNCPEMIFAVPFTDDLGRMVGGWFHLLNKTLHQQNQKTYGLVEAPWAEGGICAIPQFINTYHPRDKRKEATWIMGQQYSNTGDTLYCSIDPKNAERPLAFTNTLETVDYSDEFEGYRIGKFEIAYGTQYQLENDFPIFRLTDIYMMKAECLLRQGNATGAAELVTEIRKRAFDDINDATITGDTLLKGSLYNYGLVDEFGTFPEPGGGSDIQYGRFLDELGWEFACEARRRQDLIRFGVFTTKDWYNSKDVTLAVDPDADGHTKVFAIPQGALDNNPNLTQNPGY